ncbi:MAG: HTH domain-containing protein [Chloroflexi bacterium]|nr:HTH domain-containing protein [Chloroflexota bacterium]
MLTASQSEGLSVAGLAARFGVSQRTVFRVLQRLKATGRFPAATRLEKER